MGVRSTSRKAYFRDVKPSLNVKQNEVWVALAMSSRPANNQEIANYLHKPINVITPRMNELVKLNRVEEAFRAIYPVTGRRVIYWKVVKDN